MALTGKGFTPPPTLPQSRSGGPGPNIPKKSSPIKKSGLPGKRRNILREEIITPATQVLRNVIFPKKSVKKEKEKTPERRRGAFDILTGPTPKKEKKAISPKTKSSLFGKGEKAIKYQEFEKFLKDPSLYGIDKLSWRQRRKKWKEIFKETGTGYLKRWKVRKYFKDRAFKSPKTMKEVREKSITKIYEKKFLEK